MADVLIRDLSDSVIESYTEKARRNGTTLEQELRDLIETHPAHIPFTRAERVKFITENMARFPEPVPSLTLDEIREGLM